MILPGCENGVYVDAVDAQILQIIHIFRNAPESSAQPAFDGLTIVVHFGGFQRNIVMRGGEAVRENVIDHRVMYPIRHPGNIRPVVKRKLKILGAIVHQMIGKNIAVVQLPFLSVVQLKIVVNPVKWTVHYGLPVIMLQIAGC